VSYGASARVLPIDPVAGATMPTVLYIRRDGSSLVGRRAIGSYLADQRERGPIRRQVKPLGIRMASSDNKTSRPAEAHLLADVGSPGRLFRSLKSFLGSPLDSPTSVFGSGMSLTATILEHVRVREAVMTGGSSGLPAARALLARRFPLAARRDFAAFSSVATGPALA